MPACSKWATSVKPYVGIVIGGAVLIFFLMEILSRPSEQRPAPIINAYEAKEKKPAATSSRPSEDSELHILPNYFGGNPVSDGRTYSVALVVEAALEHKIPLGTQMFAQGKLLQVNYAFGGLALIQAEQRWQTAAGEVVTPSLFCFMSEEEGAEVSLLYRQGEIVQVFGEYRGFSADNLMRDTPVLQKCKVASATENVVRPAQVPEMSRPAPAAAQNNDFVVIIDKIDNLPANGNAMYMARGHEAGEPTLEFSIVCDDARPDCLPLRLDEGYRLEQEPDCPYKSAGGYGCFRAYHNADNRKALYALSLEKAQ
jgi:hypothetical protein